ncbi:hypothetical protein BRC2024_PQPTKSFJ_CDS_0098 [Tegunavirus sp. BRC001]
MKFVWYNGSTVHRSKFIYLVGEDRVSDDLDVLESINISNTILENNNGNTYLFGM